MTLRRLVGFAATVVLCSCLNRETGRAQDTEPSAATARQRYLDRAASDAEAVARAPADVAAARRLVRTYLTVGENDKAEAAARAFIQRNPASGEIWTILGEVLAARGDRSGARAAFTSALGAASDSLTARLNLGILLYESGRPDSAAREFDRVLTRYNRAPMPGSTDLLAIATAARYRADGQADMLRDAVRIYGEAIAADSGNITARVRLGWLFLDKYNGTDALAAFREALAVAPDHPEALYGLGRARMFSEEDGWIQDVERSLAINPNFVPARLTMARVALDAEDYPEATRMGREILGLDPASIEAASLVATARYLAGDSTGFAAARSMIDSLDPRSPEPYVTLADISARSRRYAESVRLAALAISRDSSAWRAWATRGTNRLRIGDMTGGRRDLETAFAGDPFDLWTKNTLDLLDQLERYPATASPRFRFVTDSAESTLLSLYLAPLAEEAYDSLTRHYGYQPATPVRVELFRRKADFSVRTVRLAGFDALGVSFGPVVAHEFAAGPRPGRIQLGEHPVARTGPHLPPRDDRRPGASLGLRGTGRI